MNLTELEKFVQNYLIETAGFEPGAFDVISANVTGGSCNLTFVIAGLIAVYHKSLIESLGEATPDNEYSLKPDENGEWWLTHKHVGSGEPFEQFLNS